MIQDYATLQTAIGNWLQRGGDSNFTARIPEFIQLAESILRTELDDVSQRSVTTITFTNGVADLPADYDGLNEINGDFNCEQIRFDVVNGQIQTCPPITGDATLDYNSTIPALSDTTTTNWLLSIAPHVYLYGALLQAEFYGWNDERLGTIKAGYDEGVAKLNVDSERRRWNRDQLGPRILRP